MSASRSDFRYSLASSAERSSGLPTISISGVPERFKSTSLPPSACTFLPASSSRWMRSSPILPSPGTVTKPPAQMGISYCEI